MIEKLPLVSVIVPIYNVEKYLEKCIDSLLAQTYKNLEIILVDDGSTDNSGKIADKYAKQKNVRIAHEKNGGLSHARNVGLKLAKGTWIAFVDSDDYVNKNFVKALYELAKKENADIATCNFKSVTSDGSFIKKSPSWPTEPLSGKEAVSDMLKNKRPAYIWLSLFRASLLKNNKITFAEGRRYEDILPRIQALFFAKKVAYTNEQLYYYVSRKTAITHKPFSEKTFDDIESAIAGIRDFLKDSDCELYVNYFEFFFLAGLLNNLILHGYDNIDSFWKPIRKILKNLFPKTTFPTPTEKRYYKNILRLSSSRKVYEFVYKKLRSNLYEAEK